MTPNSDLRKQPPTPLTPRAFNLPKPFETTLVNGLRVVIVEDKRLPIASYRLALPVGTVFDPQDAPGLIEMMTAMMKEGTLTRTSQQIAEDIERLGAGVSVSASSDNTIVAASSLAGYSNDVLNLMADVALNPTFPEKELELAKQNAKQGLIAQRAQPEFLAEELQARVLFGSHPYSRISATPDSIDRMTRDKLIAQHKALFVPNNAYFIAVGDVNRDALVKQLESLFANWKQGSAPTANFAAPPARTTRAVYVVDRPGSAQSQVGIGNLALTRNSPDYFAALLMNQVLGGGASSRLFLNLREKKDLTYGAYTDFDTRRLAGSLSSSAPVRTEVTGTALKEFFYELDRIRNEAVPEQELRDAKNYLTGVFPIRLETQEGLTNQLVNIKTYGLPADYLETYRERINAVTPADVQRVARQYITPDRAAITIVGDARQINEQIKPFAGTIEIFDTNGKPKELTPVTSTSNNGGASATAAGTWNLTINAPGGQSIPMTMTIQQSGDSITGSLQSPVGEGTITGGTFNSNKLTADANITFQGNPVTVKIEGIVAGDAMNGNVTASVPGIPALPFTGTKAN